MKLLMYWPLIVWIGLCDAVRNALAPQPELIPIPIRHRHRVTPRR